MKIARMMQPIGLAVVIVFLLASVCDAQVSTSTITGSVLDASGAAVPGAKVVAKNEGTGVTYETKTTSSGDYTLSALPPGLYTLTVTQQGFKTFTSVHNVLTVPVAQFKNVTWRGIVTQHKM
jgi:carboxypeptidase family protein